MVEMSYLLCASTFPPELNVLSPDIKAALTLNGSGNGSISPVISPSAC